MHKILLLVASLLLLGAPAALAVTPPEIRLLQSDDPADWERAVKLILPSDQNAVPTLSVSTLTKRLSGLRPETQLRVMRGMNYALKHDPRVVAVFRQLAADADDDSNARHKVKQEAQRALDQLARDAGRYPAAKPSDAAPPWLGSFMLTVSLLLILAPLALGAALLLWGLRLLQLQRLLRHLPVSKTRTLAPGLVALRGEVQRCGEPLFHPATDELCVYYVGAERQSSNLRFWLVDDSGRVKVDPAGMVMLSEDGMLVPGEEVHLIASAERVAEGIGAERWLLRKAHTPRTAFERLMHFIVNRLFGLFSGSNLSKMLFSDPRRCFWIWDDLEGKPFGNRREVALVVTIFVFAAAWITVAAIAATALLDRGALLFWQG